MKSTRHGARQHPVKYLAYENASQIASSRAWSQFNLHVLTLPLCFAAMEPARLLKRGSTIVSALPLLPGPPHNCGAYVGVLKPFALIQAIAEKMRYLVLASDKSSFDYVLLLS